MTKTNRVSVSNMRQVFSIPEACDFLGVGKDLVYAEINRGRLPSIKAGKRRLIRRAACEQWLTELEEKTTRGMGFGEAV